jgi:hypothetical protein
MEPETGPLSGMPTKLLVEELLSRFGAAILIFREALSEEKLGGVQVAWVGDTVECAGLAGFGQSECFEDMRKLTDRIDETNQEEGTSE